MQNIFANIIPIYTGLWKDIMDQGAIMTPWFFSFGANKSPKAIIGTFLAIKTTWRVILDDLGSLV